VAVFSELFAPRINAQQVKHKGLAFREGARLPGWRMIGRARSKLFRHGACIRPLARFAALPWRRTGRRNITGGAFLRDFLRYHRDFGVWEALPFQL